MTEKLTEFCYIERCRTPFLLLIHGIHQKSSKKGIIDHVKCNIVTLYLTYTKKRTNNIILLLRTGLFFMFQSFLYCPLAPHKYQSLQKLSFQNKSLVTPKSLNYEYLLF